MATQIQGAKIVTEEIEDVDNITWPTKP